MPIRKLLLLLVVLGTVTSIAVAQDTATKPQEKLQVPDRVVKPFLWKIDGTTENYIFGTAHIADPRILKMHPTARKQYEAADAVMFELDFARTGPEQMERIRLPAGDTLANHIPAELIQRLDARLASLNPQLSHAAVNARPVVWPLLVPQLEAQMRFNATALDMQLYQQSRQRGQTVGGLEDPAEQLKGLLALSREEQTAFLRSSLNAMDEADEEKRDALTETIGYYLRGDAEAFREYFLKDLSAGDLSPQLAAKVVNALLYERNKRMADAIADLIRKNPDRKHFFAVGTAHMLGKKSVLTYLQEKGIKTTRVTK